MEQWFRAVDQDNSGQIDAKELGQAGVSLEYVDICAHTHIAPTYISIIKFLFFFLGQALANGDGSMFSEEACRLMMMMVMMMKMMMMIIIIITIIIMLIIIISIIIITIIIIIKINIKTKKEATKWKRKKEEIKDKK